MQMKILLTCMVLIMGSDYDMLLKELEDTISSIFSHYRKNQFKTNAAKYHLFESIWTQKYKFK